ncbi:MAG TPA: ribose ABC transporter permease, partial [Roseiarcus sp.]|nr:ribose ABC transporter permease [Roseiarcus sp.]
MTAAPGAARAATNWRVRLTSGVAFRFESLLVLAILVAAMAALSPFFLSISNFLNILLATATIGVLAIGATFVISSAGIDLSVGSVLGFSGVVGCLLMSSLDLPWPLGIVACIGAGAAAGLVNGFLVTRGQIPPFIVTLGMLGVARGAGLVLTNGLP